MLGLGLANLNPNPNPKTLVCSFQNPCLQVWSEALHAKAAAPYMNHLLLEGDHLSDAQFVG